MIESGARGDYRGAGDGAAAPQVASTDPENAMADERRPDDALRGRIRELDERAAEDPVVPERYADQPERVSDAEVDAEKAMTDDIAPGDADDEQGPGDPQAANRAAAGDGGGDNEPPVAPDAPVPTSESTGAAPERRETPPIAGTGGAALSLRVYSRRLADRGEQAIADAVREYAERVRGVERGELPAVLSVAPAAIAPEMVGAVLVRRRLDGLLEFFRNVLIFMPVLWTWVKLYFAIDAYSPGPDQNFFDFWVNTGGPIPVRYLEDLGGKLDDAALQVAGILVLLVAVNALVGMSRGRTDRQREREARSFAAVLARAEAAGAAQRVEDPQSALAGFAIAATSLTTELRSVGESLKSSAAPFAESVELARQALSETSEAVAGQQQRLDDVIEQLRGIAGVGDQLAALQTEFAKASQASEQSARALSGIHGSLGPSARDLADAAGSLRNLAEHLSRMTDAMAGTIAALDEGFDVSAKHLSDAATRVNAVAARVLDELGDGRSGGR